MIATSSGSSYSTGMRANAVCEATMCGALNLAALAAYAGSRLGVVGGAGYWEVDALMVSCSFWTRAKISSNDSGLSSNIIGAMPR